MKKRAIAIDTHAICIPVTLISLKAKNAVIIWSRMEVVRMVPAISIATMHQNPL